MVLSGLWNLPQITTGKFRVRHSRDARASWVCLSLARRPTTAQIPWYYYPTIINTLFMLKFIRVIIPFIVILLVYIILHFRNIAINKNIQETEIIPSYYKGVVIARNLPQRSGKLIILSENKDTIDVGSLSGCLFTNGQLGDTIIKLKNEPKFLLIRKKIPTDTIICYLYEF
jgi:hypothetical protein